MVGLTALVLLEWNRPVQGFHIGQGPFGLFLLITIYQSFGRQSGAGNADRKVNDSLPVTVVRNLIEWNQAQI